MYKLKLSVKAKAQLKKISKVYYQEAISIALLDIKEDPFIGKPLTRELTGRFSYRIGAYRIVYKVKEKEKIIFILSAGHRSTVY